MKKTFTSLLSAVAIMLLALLFVPSSDAYASNGPELGAFSISHINVSNTESLKTTIVFAPDSYNAGYNEEKGSVKGVSYDAKTNTLTLKKADVFGIYICEMGDDFKIELVGDNKVYSIDANVYSHSMNLTFVGDGTLTLGAYKTPAITLDAYRNNGTISFEGSVTVKLENNNDFVSAVAVNNTLTKNAIKIANNLACLGSIKQEESSYSGLDTFVTKIGTYAEKDKKQYFIVKEYAPDYSYQYFDIYYNGTKTEGNLSYDDIMNKGYHIISDPFNDTYDYFLGYVGNFEISPKVKETIPAPKASVKVSDKTASFTVSKTKGAKGYTISYSRLYERDMQSAEIIEATTKNFDKPGKKKQTLTIKNLAPGSYMATVTPYKTVKGKKVYGSESKAVYFEIK